MNIVTAKDIKPDLAKKVYGLLGGRDDGYSLTVEDYAKLRGLCSGKPISERTIRYRCSVGMYDAVKDGEWLIHKNEGIKLLYKFFPQEKEQAMKDAYDRQMQMYG